MKAQIFLENEWLYPDTEITRQDDSVEIDTARGANAGFQILTDMEVDIDTPVKVHWDDSGIADLDYTVYQLLPARVEENSGKELFTTLDYDSVSSFVTRQAPFYVYDVTREIDDGILKQGRVAFYIRVSVPENIQPGTYSENLRISINDSKLTTQINLNVYKAVVPKLEEANFSMINWLNLESIEKFHSLQADSKSFWNMVDKYLKNQIDMRNNHIMLPSGVPIRDETGKVTDFDFSAAEKLGNMALKAGFNHVYGGFVARFKEWQKPEHYLNWDRDISSISFEAYRQLKIYFSKLWSIVIENGWKDNYMQCLVDEPQFPNSEHYRILSGICRKFMPGVIINDPVESTDLEGAVDIWVVKQSVFEKHLSKFKELQSLGEEMWIYTCGFPAGYTMNRAMDLPLLVSRLPMWMCYLYDAKGFLHWGYNVFNEDPFESTCYYRGNPEQLLPPGNAFIVYPGDNGPWYSMRGHLQRAGAEDFELLYQLGLKDEEKAHEIIRKVCTSFDDYNSSADNFQTLRRELLEELE
ncbi:MAG: DUF4091 domain-containing protein [Clostridiales bacterium]|nr:DUF4091 domain-containing protein [Clostridiales bacterium]